MTSAARKPKLYPIEPGGCAPPVFVHSPICERCLDTGWAFLSHSDEAREVCTCKAGDQIQLHIDGQAKA